VNSSHVTNSLCDEFTGSPSYDVQIVTIADRSPGFAQLTLLPNPRPDTWKAPLLIGGIYISMQYVLPGPTRPSILNCTSIGSAIFAQFTTVALKRHER